MIPILKSILGFSSPLTSHQGYRSDIDGLRAVAVSLVVGFHAFPNFFPGGYIGVDIFFIISGYLISGIIFKQLQVNKFSFFDFYAKRINRIFPALIFVLLVSILLSRTYNFQNEIIDFNNSLISAVSFVANLFFYFQSDYFDTAAETKPLLHLWSLGIEEQFYIIWPVLLMLLWKRNIIKPWSMAILIFASFTASIFVIQTNQSAAFYLPHLRFWELLSGSVLAYFHVASAKFRLSGWVERNSKLVTNLCSIIGFLLIGTCLFVLNKSSMFPGWWALLPTIGGVLIIAAGKDSLLNKLILSNPLVVFIGVISYPVYLWHWPLLSFLHIEMGATPKPYRVIAVLLSVLMGWLTFILIERPIRFAIHSKAKTYVLAIMLFSIGVYGFVDTKHRERQPIDAKNAFVNHYKQYPLTNSLKTQYKYDCGLLESDGSLKSTVSPDCFTSKTSQSVFIWGDSHAQQLNYGLIKALPDSFSVLQIASFGCAPSVSFMKTGIKNNCDRSNAFALEKIKTAKPTFVVLAQRHDHEQSNWPETIVALKLAGVNKIIVVGPVPEWSQFLNRYFARHYWDEKPTRLKENLNQEVFKTDALMKQIIAKTEGVSYVSMLDLLCNQQGCQTYLNNDYNNSLTTFDYGHLTLVASEYVAKNAILLTLK